MNIGLDAMGGDFAPDSTIQGAIEAIQVFKDTDSIFLFGDEKLIRSKLEDYKADPDSFTIVHAPEHIGMGEHPLKAFSRKPQSSIATGFKWLKSNYIDVFASAGNSGALIVGSMYTINTIPSIIRPCTSVLIPKENGGVSILLDVGTNPDPKPDVMYQFGVLGSIYAKEVFEIPDPKVGLLNIGEEEEKGNLLTQHTYQLMKDSTDFNFTGNVEARDILSGETHVIVCDGFTGNVVLKQVEAMYRLMKKRKLMDEYIERFNYENYGGTPILGINGSVVLGHGISSPLAIKNMLVLSKDIVEAKLYQKIQNAFNSYPH